jgi:glutaredoxin
MEYTEPYKLGFTVYSKSGCPNCVKVKRAIKEKKILLNEIDCDEYLLEDKERFLTFIREKIGTECRVFPIIFFDCKFVGGYNEALEIMNKFQLSFEENF